MKIKFKVGYLAAFAAVALAALPAAVSASHSWNGYHWARTANPFTLKLGDNVSGAWDSILSTTSSDWSQSTVLDTTIVPGQANPRNCRATSGRVEVCNSTYGNTGWLGVATVWVKSDTHITQSTVKLNDTYFNTATYNTVAWRNLVSCQEVGHTLGLDHQDTNFNNANLGTCMDYTNDPGTNQHPNQHDYDELAIIYTHLDLYTTLSAAPVKGKAGVVPPGADASDWGTAIQNDAHGRPILFVRGLGGGEKQLTWVFWTPPGR
ncbi:MAG: hypothetical protein HY261_07405 [Chloroflexi bacterium]|nr:hypothetical protein [Chloroflexota bacterium]